MNLCNCGHDYAAHGFGAYGCSCPTCSCTAFTPPSVGEQAPTLRNDITLSYERYMSLIAMESRYLWLLCNWNDFRLRYTDSDIEAAIDRERDKERGAKLQDGWIV